MSFLNLWALWLAAAVVPALLILYFLKLRRREELVASTLLWKRAIQDLQVNAPFQRLRKNLLLLLQLLVLLASIIALARPIVESSATTEGRLVILLDRSGSMNAVESDGQTRLELAKEQAVRLVKTLNRRSQSWLGFLRLGGAATKTQAMVVAFSDRASVVAPFTPNTADLVDVIRALEPTDGSTNVREALSLAEAYLAPPTMTTDQTPISAEVPAKVVLISDGGLSDVGDAVLRQGQIELIAVGQTRDNVGITALRTQRNYERPEILNVFLQIENFSAEPVTSTVALEVDGQLAEARVREIQLAAAAAPTESGDDATTRPSASAQALSFELTLERAGVVTARLVRSDALAGDNVAHAIVPAPRRMRVLVVTANNFFLDSVLRGLPLQERAFVTPAQYEAGLESRYAVDGHSAYDVVIFDKFSPRALPTGNFLFLGAVPPGEEISAGEALDEPHPLVWWDETHPILRHVALEYVYVGKAVALKMPPEAETLIEGPRGPVLSRYARGGRHFLVLSFAVENSTWWQKPSFPVFAYNAIRYLGGAGVGEQAAVHPGDTVRITLPEGAGAAALTTPGGLSVPIQPDSTGTAYFGGTQQVGIYRLAYSQRDEQQTERYAVNLEDRVESNIAPRSAAQLGSPQIKEGRAISTATPEVWRWFVGAALVIALFEWYIYNRRVMI